MKRLVLAIVLIIVALAIGAQLQAQEFHKYPEQRCVEDQGYGMIINDLEAHARKGHPMRNEGDPGNWVHELTHQVNSDLRCKTRANDNAFYILDGDYFILLEPKVTLRQVAAEVPKAERGTFYETYLVEMRQWWNNEPLFVLDEMTAYTNGLLYHVMSNTEDDYRLLAVKEFQDYADALVRAVKKHDSDYSQLDELEAVVKYQKERAVKIIGMYEGEQVEPDQINPDNDYDLSWRRWRSRRNWRMPSPFADFILRRAFRGVA